MEPMNKRYINLLALAALHAGAWAQTGTAPTQPQREPETKTDLIETDSEEALRTMIRNSGGSEEMIIRGLEEYLVKYPRSVRRGEIEEQIYQLAIKGRDRDRTISYGEKLVLNPDAEPGRIDLLTTLVSTLRARREKGDLQRALQYAEQLVTEFEKLIADSKKPGRLSRVQWQEQKSQGLASIYLVRGRVLADLDQLDRAAADLRRSYKLYPLAGTALSLSEINEKQQRPDEALKFSVLAFVLAYSGDEQMDIRAIRRRMGALYTAKNNNEKGLGEMLLEIWDRYTRERDEKLVHLDPPNPNAGLTEPFLFKLTRPDGSVLDMASLRGKIVVLNFWATWCGPCRTELPLFQKTIEKYRKDASVAFLAVSTDEDRDLVQPYLDQNKHKLPVFFADGIDEHFNISSIPTTIVINKDGQVSFRMRGFNPNDDFVARLGEIIEAARK